MSRWNVGTVVQRQTFADMQDRIAHARTGFDNLKSNVLPAFNDGMKSAGVTIKPGG
jgi:hypothetical protein